MSRLITALEHLRGSSARVYQQYLRDCAGKPDEAGLETIVPAFALAPKVYPNLRIDAQRAPDRVSHLQFALRWASYGQPTFILHPDAVGAALLTRCDMLQVGDLRLPFSSFVFVLPHPSPLRMLVTDADRDNELDKEAEISHITVQQFYQVAEGELRQTLKLILYCRGKDCALSTVTTVDERSIAKWVANTEQGKGADTLLTGDRPVIAAGIRLVVNNLVYINEMRRQGKLQLTVPPARKTPPTQSMKWRIPGPIKLSPELRAAATASGATAQWALKVRFVVRGHWRNQAVGKGRAERKLKWIFPHWKGPKEGEVLARTYEVTDVENQ